MRHLRLIPSVRTNPSPAAAAREPASSCIAGGAARPRPLSPRPLIPPVQLESPLVLSLLMPAPAPAPAREPASTPPSVLDDSLWRQPRKEVRSGDGLLALKDSQSATSLIHGSASSTSCVRYLRRLLAHLAGGDHCPLLCSKIHALRPRPLSWQSSPLSSPLLAILSSMLLINFVQTLIPFLFLIFFDLQRQFRGTRGAEASNFCTPS